MGSIFLELANILFGEGTYAWKDRYHELHIKLRQARIPLPVDLYISKALFYSIFVGLGIEMIGFKIAMDWFKMNGTPDIGSGAVAVWLGTNLDIILAFIFSIFCFLLTSEIIYGLFMMLPDLKASIRRTKIDQSIPHAVTYMYAMSRSGMNLLDLFRSIGSYSHIYGTTADEIRYIIRDMEYFGYDLITALQNASMRSPSEKFKDFIDGLISILTSGGNVISYMNSKSEQYHFSASREQKAFLSTLGMLAEVYITGFVAGPLFIMTILLVLGVIGGGSLGTLHILIYLFIPLATLIFIILLDTLNSFNEEIPDFQIRTKNLNVFKDVSIRASESDESRLFRHLLFYRKLSDLNHAIINPIETLSHSPKKIFWISFPLGIFYFLSSADLNLFRLNGEASLSSIFVPLDEHIMFSLLIMLVPFVFFYELHRQRIKKIEDQMPEFLKRLASINEAGISLTEAISIAARANIGVLRSEIMKVANDIQWGTVTANALRKLEYRIRTGTIARIITLLVKASESTKNIQNVLYIASNTADNGKRLRNERNSNMFVYVFVIYMTFFVFLFIVYILSIYFLPSIPGGTDDVGDVMALSIGINTAEYTMLFFHAALVQGFCSGLIAGQMGEGLLFAGLKHSIIMVGIAYIAFTLLI